MLSEKINQLTNTPIYNKIKNFLLEENHYMNVFWIFCAFLFMSMFSLPSLLSFTLFVISIKAFQNSDINYLKNLLKFWCFNFLVYEGHNCMIRVLGNTAFTKMIEFIIMYNLIIYSNDWFSNGMTSNQSVFFVENMVDQVTKLYQINYLSLDFYTKFVFFLGKKYYLLSNYIRNTRKYIRGKFDKQSEMIEEVHTGEPKEEIQDEQVKKEEVKESLPESDDDSDQKLLETILKETLETTELPDLPKGEESNKNCLDEIDDDEFVYKK